MVSEYAIAIIDDLRDDGYDITLRQIIELNALGCAVEFAQPEVISAPRVAKAGESYLRELTIQAHLWFRDYAARWWEGESLVIALAWANCHARKRGYFRQYNNERKTRIKIVAWYRSLNCTELEFHAAYNYVNRVEMFRGKDEHTETDEFQAVDPPDGLTDLVNEALSIGLTADAISTSTRREIKDIIQRHTRLQLVAGGKADRIARSIKNSAENRFLSYVDDLKAKQRPTSCKWQVYL